MTFMQIGANWVAHTGGFTVQLVDPQRIAYGDADGRYVLSTEVPNDQVEISPDDLSACVDDGHDPTTTSAVLSRIIAGICCLGGRSICSSDEVDLEELIVLLLDLEGMSPSQLVAIAEDVTSEGASGFIADGLSIDHDDAVATVTLVDVTDRLTGEGLQVSVPQTELLALIQSAAALTFAGDDAVLDVQLLDREERDLTPLSGGALDPSQSDSTVFTLVSKAGGATTALVLADDSITLEAMTSTRVLVIDLEPEAALPFALEAEAVVVDGSGGWSHDVSVQSGGSKKSLPPTVQTVGDLAIWAASELTG